MNTLICGVLAMSSPVVHLASAAPDQAPGGGSAVPVFGAETVASAPVQVIYR